jgi:hypothetical protein
MQFYLLEGTDVLFYARGRQPAKERCNESLARNEVSVNRCLRASSNDQAYEVQETIIEVLTL